LYLSIASRETKTVTRKQYKKRARGGKDTRYTFSKGFPFSPRACITLKYCYNSISSNGAIDGNILKLNSCYDPDVTYTGHQPMGFDQYAALYNYYRVHHTRVVGTFTGIFVAPLICTVLCNGTPTAITDPDRAAEQPEGKRFLMPTIYQEIKKINWSFDMAKALGMTREQYRTDDVTASVVSTNPAAPVYLHTLIHDGGGAVGAAGAIAIEWTLYMDVEFYGPALMTQS